jgi:two-component sensor histidine kinase
MKKSSLFLLTHLLFLLTVLNAQNIEITKGSDNILKKSAMFLDIKERNISQIKENVHFSKFQQNDLNFGFMDQSTLWIKLELYNPLDKNLTKILQVRNPLLEYVSLYTGDEKRDAGALQKSTKELHHSFLLEFYPHQFKTYYLQIKNSTTSLRLGLFLKDLEVFLQDECEEQRIIFIFFTIIGMLMAYNFLLYLYSKEIAYFYYSLYLLAVMFQQATYLGLTQIYFPYWFVYYDNLSVVLKVNLMYITAIVFARSFLQTQRYKKIDSIYKLLLLLGIVEIPLFGTGWFYVPEIAILTGFVFVLYNMFASSYIWRQGYKQARFFVLGWAFQVVGFSLMIFDGLGIISIMNELPDLVMAFTAIEAILLSLAFVDRYKILEDAKNRSDTLLLQEMKKREEIVQKEIIQATKDLHSSLANEKSLLKELHHRTKNNLQLILSLIRLQSNNLAENEKSAFIQLESRITAIAKAQELLYIHRDLQEIDMQEYISELCSSLEQMSEKDVTCEITIDSVHMPIKEASPIGLIVNELVTNSIKHINLQEIKIEIFFIKNGHEFKLVYRDNSPGFDLDKRSKKSLGMQLIKTLVEDQLEGNMDIQSDGRVEYTIRFWM